MAFLLLSEALFSPSIFIRIRIHIGSSTRKLISPGVSVLLSSRRNVLRNSITKLNEKVRIMWFPGVESKSDDGHQNALFCEYYTDGTIIDAIVFCFSVVLSDLKLIFDSVF